MRQLTWRPADTRLLCDCIAAGLSASQTASVLGRSVLAIKGKARHQGLNFTSRATPPIATAEPTEDEATAKEDAYLLAVWRANVKGFGPTILPKPITSGGSAVA